MAKKPAVAQPEDLAQAKSSDQSVAAVTSFAPDRNNGTGVGVEPAVNSSGLVSGLTLYTSNQMENLADLCALLMSEYPQKDAFAHVYTGSSILKPHKKISLIVITSHGIFIP